MSRCRARHSNATLAARAALVAVACVLAACPGDDNIGQADGGMMSGDASTQSGDGDVGGDCPLLVRFVLEEDLPGMRESFELDSAVLKLQQFRMISDTTGGGGAPETTVEEIELTWEEGDKPSAWCFESAPDGLYQEALTQLSRYRFKGRMPDERRFDIDVMPSNLQLDRRIAPPVRVEDGETGLVVVSLDALEILELLSAESDQLPEGDPAVVGNNGPEELLESLRKLLGELFAGQ